MSQEHAGAGYTEIPTFTFSGGGGTGYYRPDPSLRDKLKRRLRRFLCRIIDNYLQDTPPTGGCSLKGRP